MTNTKQKQQSNDMPSLNTQKSDIIALFARAGLGAVPFVGSVFAEVAGAIIPNQRIDRIVKFAEKLESKLSDTQKVALRSQLSDEEFVDILEEGMIQASKSTSDDRREYLALLIANGLSDKAIEYGETRRLLTILGDLSDAEIISLRYHLVRTIGGDEEFREKHKKFLMNTPVTSGSSQDEKDKAALKDNYKEHLISLGLLKNEYRLSQETGLQEIDTFTKAPKISGQNLTGTGRLLLRYIGLSETT
jgi:hypothetical protein